MNIFNFQREYSTRFHRDCCGSFAAQHALTNSSYISKMNGIFAVNKPSGPSSADIVFQLKKAMNASTLIEGSEANTGGAGKKKNAKSRRRGGKQWWKNRQQDVVKVGHGGTLDPLAEGVCVIGVGEGTKQLTNFLTDCTKTYEAVAMFGVSTDTYDSTGQITERAPTKHLTVDAIKKAISDKFSGEILQFPPIYSALKMNGKPLYEYAREGLPLPKPIESRKVKVDFFEVVDDDLKWDQTEYTLPAEGEASPEVKEFILKQGQEMLKNVDESDLDKLTSSLTTDAVTQTDEEDKKYPTLKLRFSVSSGTYIRSLIHDLAKTVGSAAHMTKLVRVQQGPYKLGDNVFDFDEIVKGVDTDWVPLVELAIANGPSLSLEELRKKLEEKRAEQAVADAAKQKDTAAATPDVAPEEETAAPAIDTPELQEERKDLPVEEAVMSEESKVDESTGIAETVPAPLEESIKAAAEEVAEEPSSKRLKTEL